MYGSTRDARAFSRTWPAAVMQFFAKEESVYIRKEFNSHTTTVRHTNIAAVLFFWETNMTDNDNGSIQPGSFFTNKFSSYQKKPFAPCNASVN